jgi:hypothetical protein
MVWPATIFLGEHVCVCGSHQRTERVKVRELWLLVCGHCQNFVVYARRAEAAAGPAR